MTKFLPGFCRTLEIKIVLSRKAKFLGECSTLVYLRDSVSVPQMENPRDETRDSAEAVTISTLSCHTLRGWEEKDHCRWAPTRGRAPLEGSRCLRAAAPPPGQLQSSTHAHP